MLDFLLALLPPGLDATVALGLIALSVLTSFITASLSLGGGMLMVSVMSLIFPAPVVIPVHGAVQLGSNAGRTFLQRRHVQWPIVLWMTLGAIPGAIFGGQFAIAIPDSVFRLIIGCFILIAIWLPKPPINATGPVTAVVASAVISAVGMVVGATGPLTVTFLRGIEDRRALVGTHAMLMAMRHGIKVIVFVGLGFAFADYLPLILAMIAAGFVGTALGTKLLLKMPESVFRLGFKIVLSLIALDLLRRAIFAG